MSLKDLIMSRNNPGRTLSISIVSWNTRDLLLNCIKSICESVEEFALEIIVVDNASNDGSAEAVRKAYPDVLLVENKMNRGFAAANNQALRLARGGHVLLLNPDTVVLPNALQKMWKCLEEHPEAGVVGCKLLNPDMTVWPSVIKNHPSPIALLFHYSPLWRRLLPGPAERLRFGTRDWKNEGVLEVVSVVGACMMVRREVIETVGELNEKYFLYNEEGEWCYRIRKRGWKIYLTPEAQIIHYCQGSASQVPEMANREFAKGMFRFSRDNCGRVRTGLVKWLLISEFLVKLSVIRAVGLHSVEDRKQILRHRVRTLLQA